jgi:glycosyltransferase involved in cell wall biosynthesis
MPRQKILSHAMARVSVVVPAYRAPSTLSQTVSLLLNQGVDDLEVIVVASADRNEELPVLDDDPRLRLVTHVPRLGAAQARNRGAAHGQGDYVAFTDADVLPSPSWLRELIAASEDGSLCVAGSVRNGTPESAAGTVEYLLDFLDLHPERPRNGAWHGATCNLLVPRALWARYGPFPEDLAGGEDTLLTMAAWRDGRFTFAPRAEVTHLNRTRFRDVLGQQYLYGRFSAQIGRRSRHPAGPLLRVALLAPVAAAARVVSLYRRLTAGWARDLLRPALRLSPLVVAALAAWGAGLLVEGLRLKRRR